MTEQTTGPGQPARPGHGQAASAEQPAGPERTVLAQAAELAGYAPSVHNTQPWRWRVGQRELDLFADRSRQLQISDPQGRLLLLSCGAALHHALTALAFYGWAFEVSRLPDQSDPDHLAHIRLGEQGKVPAEGLDIFEAMKARHTDRRPAGPLPVGDGNLVAIRNAVIAEGLGLHLLTPDQVLELGSASAQADRLETMDPAQREELAYWIGGDRQSGTGVPDAVLPQSPPQTLVPGRDFVHYGNLQTGEGHDRSASFAVLFGRGDEPADWLRAGEALSAGWLTATRLGVTVLPFSAVIEVAATREQLRRVLAGVGYPQLVLRLGMPDPRQAQVPRTPRLPAEQIIDFSG